jgi:hypothetical protein
LKVFLHFRRIFQFFRSGGNFFGSQTLPQAASNFNNYSNNNSRNGSYASLAGAREDILAILRSLDSDRNGTVTGLCSPNLK